MSLSIDTVGNMTQTGNFTVTGGTINGALLTTKENAIVRTNVTAQESREYPVDLLALRVHDAPQTLLTTAAADDLGVTGATYGTNGIYVTGRDCKSATITGYARGLFQLPQEYKSGASLTIRIAAGMLTTVSDTSATVDLEFRKLNESTGVGSDLCATAATTCNSLTFGDKDFTITPTGLVAGDVFDFRVALAVVDGAGVTAVTPAIAAIKAVMTVEI